MERRIELSPLSLDKETIARLDEAQLLSISGGAGDDNGGGAQTTCESGNSCMKGGSCPKGGSC